MRLFWKVYTDRRTPLWSKLLFTALAVGYAVMPIDLVPDVIIGAGWLDDLVVFPTLLWVSTLFAPKQAKEEARREVTAEPKGSAS